MEVGKKVKIGSEEFIYTCIDGSAGEYAPLETLVSLKDGTAYEFYVNRDETVKDAFKRAKENRNLLINVTVY